MLWQRGGFNQLAVGVMRRLRSPIGARDHRANSIILAAIGLSFYVAAALALNIPSDISLGLKGQAAIGMLDEMRRPFLALKEAQNSVFLSTNDSATPEEAIDPAIQAGRVLLAQYLRLGQYNPGLEQDVQALSKDFDRWAVAVSELGGHWAEVQATLREGANFAENEPHNPLLHHISRMNEAEALFLKTMSSLGEGEHPVHADMRSGSEAGRNLFALSIALVCYLVGIMFWDLRMKARAQKEAYQKELALQHLAHFDDLTGLPNPVLLRDRLSVAMAMSRRNAAEVALLYVDLDGFKQINDRFGHDAGDRVLKEVATRLLSCVRDTDTVARLGGDEFVIMLINIIDPSDSVRIANKALIALRRPFHLGAISPRIGASIGIAHYPRDGERYEDLIAVADTAMYRAKKSRPGSYWLASDPAQSYRATANAP